MKKLNIGIVGSGRMADRHAEAYQKIEGVNLIGFVGHVDIQKAKGLASKYHAEWFESVQKLLARKNLDAVDICTPTLTHTEICMECLEAGKHVLVEKPLASSLKDCDLIISKAIKVGSTLMVGHVSRFFPSHIEAKRVINMGEIGDPIMALDFFITPGGLPGKEGMPSWVKYRTLGGGNFMDNGIHCVDRLRWWLNSDIESVYTVGMKNLIEDGDMDTHGMAVLKFKNGTFATIAGVCPSTGAYENSTKIIGTKAALYIQLGKEVTVVTDTRKEVPFPFSVSKTEMYPSYSHNIAGFESELREFVGSIREHRVPSVTGYDGRAAVEGVLAIYKSFETGRPIVLPLQE
ncbi:MAG: Gfo/Idh/MocA family oxidoreductase [Candidatus Bathyarchaeia archaeon]